MITTNPKPTEENPNFMLVRFGLTQCIPKPVDKRLFGLFKRQTRMLIVKSQWGHQRENFKPFVQFVFFQETICPISQNKIKEH